MKAWIIALCAVATGIALSTSTASAMEPDMKVMRCPATWPEGGGARLVSAVVRPGWAIPPGLNVRTTTETVEAGTITMFDLEGNDQFLFCHYANGRRLVIEPPKGRSECETLVRSAPRRNELKTEGYCGHAFGGYPYPEPYRTYIAEPLTRKTDFWWVRLGSPPDHVNLSGKYIDVANTEHDIHDSWTSKLVVTNPTDSAPVGLPSGTTLILTYKTGTLVGLAVQPPRSKFHDSSQYIELIELFGNPDHGTWNDPIQSWDGADGIKLTVRNYSMRDGKWVDDPEFFVYDSRRLKDILQPKPH